MFFKYLFAASILICILGVVYGDHLFKFQADLMLGWMYSVPAYEAYERIVLYYPKSQFREEAEKMMKTLYEKNADVRYYIDDRDKGARKDAKIRQQKEKYH